uniref:Uncharacterized protein n=1 Tax=Zea mays TaxID=4577 RepID=C4J0Y6_MAIZE|nr:unknown [Zea mays]
MHAAVLCASKEEEPSSSTQPNRQTTRGWS